jgi:hypothetical protein
MSLKKHFQLPPLGRFSFRKVTNCQIPDRVNLDFDAEKKIGFGFETCRMKTQLQILLETKNVATEKLQVSNAEEYVDDKKTTKYPVSVCCSIEVSKNEESA